MLPTPYRLRREKDFQRVFAEGRRKHYASLTVIFLQRQDPGPSRFGVVAGSRLARKSTERNRIKRKIRGLLGIALRKVPPGFDVVCVAKRCMDKEKNFSYREDVRMFLEDLGRGQAGMMRRAARSR